LTDDYTSADTYFQKASEVYPEIVDDLRGDLMDHEIFLLASNISILRQIFELREKVEALENLAGIDPRFQ
jgi:hypothetical protein